MCGCCCRFLEDRGHAKEGCALLCRDALDLTEVEEKLGPALGELVDFAADCVGEMVVLIFYHAELLTVEHAPFAAIPVTTLAVVAHAHSLPVQYLATRAEWKLLLDVISHNYKKERKKISDQATKNHQQQEHTYLFVQVK